MPRSPSHDNLALLCVQGGVMDTETLLRLLEGRCTSAAPTCHLDQPQAADVHTRSAPAGLAPPWPLPWHADAKGNTLMATANGNALEAEPSLRPLDAEVGWHSLLPDLLQWLQTCYHSAIGTEFLKVQHYHAYLMAREWR